MNSNQKKGTKRTGLVALLTAASLAAGPLLVQAETGKQEIVKVWRKYDFRRKVDPNDYERVLAMVVGEDRYDIGCEVKMDAQGVSETTCYIDGGEYGPIDGTGRVDGVYQGLLQDIGQEDFFLRCLEDNHFNYRECAVPFEPVDGNPDLATQSKYDQLVRSFSQDKEKIHPLLQAKI